MRGNNTLVSTCILERTCGDAVSPGTWTLGVAHGSVVAGDAWGTCESWMLSVPKSMSSEERR